MSIGEFLNGFGGAILNIPVESVFIALGAYVLIKLFSVYRENEEKRLASLTEEEREEERARNQQVDEEHRKLFRRLRWYGAVVFVAFIALIAKVLLIDIPASDARWEQRKAVIEDLAGCLEENKSNPQACSTQTRALQISEPDVFNRF